VAADLDHAVEVGAKVRPETGAALFEAWSGGHDAGLARLSLLELLTVRQGS
jgi:hypothetical protein